MLPLLLLPAALFVLHCHRGHGAEVPPAPVNVRFLAQTFLHVLHWEPGAGLDSPRGLLYDVQYRRYGHATWTSAPNCTRISAPRCDLSLQTPQPMGRYFARVRAVAGERASNWTQSGSFTPQEATLRVANLSLSVAGNTIRVSVRPPTGPAAAANLSFQDLYPERWEYHAHVRMPAKNSQFLHVGTSLEFELPPVKWGERYCVRVTPRVASRPLPANSTEERCVSIPEAEEPAVAIRYLSLLSLVALGALALGSGLAWAYVKKPVEPPVMLTSLLSRHSHEGPREGSPPELPGLQDVVLTLERDPIHPLCLLRLEELHGHTGSDRHGGTEALPAPLEKCCWLPAWVAEGTGLQRNPLDSSRGSIDSGICLQDPLDHLGLFLGSGKQPLGSHKGGSSFQGDGVGLWAEEPQEDSKAEDPPQTWPSRSQRQSGDPLGEEGCCTLSSGLDGAACLEAGTATGYLKQASLATTSTHRTVAPTR